jgi:hypothetical protein
MDFSGLHMAPARIATRLTRLTCFALISAIENDLRSSIKLRIGSNGRVRAAEGPVRGVKGLTMNVEGTLTEIMVAYDWGSAKHCVQGLHEPEELLWLVVGKDGKSDFDKHTSLCSALGPS